MGTRNLTMVISEGKTKIAQYGQWDGYPDGQGAKALHFLLSCDFNKFKEKLSLCRFIENGSRKEKEIENFFEKIGSVNGGLTMEQSKKYHKKYPFLTRDNGATILELIYESDDELKWLYNSTDFAADSLFCEWAYVIDFDKNTFEVYEGFNSTPLTENDRFHHLTGENDYQPIKMVKMYDLYNLPSVPEFINYFQSLKKEEV